MAKGARGRRSAWRARAETDVAAPAQIYTLVLCAGVGGLLFGYDSSDIAIALPVRRPTAAHAPAAWPANAPEPDPNVVRYAPLQFIERSFPSVDSSNALKEAVVSITTLGASFGAFTGGFFSDYYGRCALRRAERAAKALRPLTPARLPPACADGPLLWRLTSCSPWLR